MADNYKNSFSNVIAQNVSETCSFEDFTEILRLNPESILTSNHAAIILPDNNIFRAPNVDINLFYGTTKNVLGELNEGGLDACIYNDDKEKKDIVLKHADIVMPIILFFSNAVAAIGINILSNYIFNKLTKAKNHDDTRIKIEYAILDESRKISIWRKIEGPCTEIMPFLEEEAKMLRGAENDVKNRKVNNCTAHERNINTSMSERANIAITTAKEMINEAKNMRSNNVTSAEMICRRSLTKIREACLLDPLNKDKHTRYLHEIGRYIHDTFRCQLEYKDNHYWVTCPVILSHTTGGFSIGGTGTTVCSICGKKILDCEHIKGARYNGVPAKRFHEMCNICGKSECEHEEGQLFDNVNAFGIVCEINLDHIAYVAKPANPLCVMHKHSLSREDIYAELSEDEKKVFVYGEHAIDCHHCVICNGE